mmetsp:Transcript_18434/g.33208  ORF Transcript_18434/g.33208 Transcript_18434/m.33208 type:complete len:223 (+) Transcript_18434:2642-3310(+)
MAEHFGIQWEETVKLPESIHFSTSAMCDSCYVLGSLTGFLYVFSKAQSYATKVTNSQITAIEFIEANLVLVGTSTGELLVVKLMTQEYVCMENYHLGTEVTHLCAWRAGCVITDNKGKLYFKAKSQAPELMVSLPADDSSVTQLQISADILVISTLKRTYLCNGSTLKQVGKKDRSAGYFGACILKDFLYVARPAGNLWKATLEGSVLSTTSFKTKTGEKIK